MKRRFLKVAAAVAAVSTGVSPAYADLQATLTAIGPTQEGMDGAVRFGTVLEASTQGLGSIWGMASFRIDCFNPAIGPPIHGSRGYSNNGIVGPRRLTITVPEWLPAREFLPGWPNVMGGDFVSCVYTQSGSARTNVLPFGTGGSTIPLGGDTWDKTEVIPFGLIKPGTVWGGGICIF
jgi:hypothetical protein